MIPSRGLRRLPDVGDFATAYDINDKLFIANKIWSTGDYLFDDSHAVQQLAAHLDEERRRDLFHELGRIGGQVWLTGTDRNNVAPLAGGLAQWRAHDLPLEQRPPEALPIR